LTGQVPSDYIGSGKGHLHELPDQLATLRTLTKWAARIEHPSEAPQLVAEAFRQMLSGRPRPAALEMPWNVFGMQAPVELCEAPDGYPAMQPDPDLIERAARLLEQARNPMIMVGGVRSTRRRSARTGRADPGAGGVFRSGRGVVGDDHPLGFTCAAGFKRWRESDLLIGVGSRLELQWFRWPDQPAGLKMVNIDIDPTQMARIKPAVGIVGDAREATALLTDAARRLGVRRTSRHEEFQAVKDRTLGRSAKCSPISSTSTSFARCCRGTGSSSRRSVRPGSPPITASRSTCRAPS
jgi:acetolactate synthase-1/2/3 large subunit